MYRSFEKSLMEVIEKEKTIAILEDGGLAKTRTQKFLEYFSRGIKNLKFKKKS